MSIEHENVVAQLGIQSYLHLVMNTKITIPDAAKCEPCSAIYHNASAVSPCVE